MSTVRPNPRRLVRVRKLLLNWASANGRSYPWRTLGCSPYSVLIAEILLKRTTAQAALRVFKPFLSRFPDLEAIDQADHAAIMESLKAVGLYRQRAKGLKEMASYLIHKHDGVIPQELDALRHVPHLGPYTARAVLSFGFGVPAAVVDSNVQRVLGRLFKGTLVKNSSAAHVQDLADHLVTKTTHQQFNWAIIDLGALVCRYDRPRCKVCPLESVCDYAMSSS